MKHAGKSRQQRCRQGSLESANTAPVGPAYLLVAGEVPARCSRLQFKLTSSGFNTRDGHSSECKRNVAGATHNTRITHMSLLKECLRHLVIYALADFQPHTYISHAFLRSLHEPCQAHSKFTASDAHEAGPRAAGPELCEHEHKDLGQ